VEKAESARLHNPAAPGLVNPERDCFVPQAQKSLS
jgi:hypothetical protein